MTQYVTQWPKLRRWAIVGASPDQQKFGNKIYRDLRNAGYKVFAVNPSYREVEGDKCYGSLTEVSAEEKPDVVDLVIPPKATIKIIDECISLGLNRVWFQPGSESPEAIKKAEDAGISVVSDACIMVKKQQWSKI